MVAAYILRQIPNFKHMKPIHYHHPLTHTLNELNGWFREPFTDFEPFSRFLGHRFRDLVGDDSRLACDLFEDDEHYALRFHLPGIAKKDVRVSWEPSGELLVSYEREEKQGEEDEALVARASRRVALPDGVDPESVTAKLTDGVLTVTVGKAPTLKPRTIEIA